MNLCSHEISSNAILSEDMLDQSICAHTASYRVHMQASGSRSSVMHHWCSGPSDTCRSGPATTWDRSGGVGATGAGNGNTTCIYLIQSAGRSVKSVVTVKNLHGDPTMLIDAAGTYTISFETTRYCSRIGSVWLLILQLLMSPSGKIAQRAFLACMLSMRCCLMLSSQYGKS